MAMATLQPSGHDRSKTPEKASNLQSCVAHLHLSDLHPAIATKTSLACLSAPAAAAAVIDIDDTDARKRMCVFTLARRTRDAAEGLRLRHASTSPLRRIAIQYCLRVESCVATWDRSVPNRCIGSTVAVKIRSNVVLSVFLKPKQLKLWQLCNGYCKIAGAVAAESQVEGASLASAPANVKPCSDSRGQIRMRLKTGTLLAAALALSGCSVLPAAGPTARQVEGSAPGRNNSEFVVLNIDDAVVSALSRVSPGLLSGSFQNRRPSADLRIGAGDTLQISIWEAGGSGLFGPAAPLAALRDGGGIPQAGARGSPLQPVTVDRGGFVFVPFAGRIHIGGETTERARALIERRLADKAIQPQAQVTVVANGANIATVGGEVGHAQIVPLSLRGDRLLDVLAAAGGAKFPAFESKVRVTRRGHGVTVDLQTVVENSSENIFVQPGDDVYVSKSQRSFTAFGATGHVGYYPFESERQTLAESVAKSGGALDNIADPSAIYLFRYESPRIVQALSPAFDARGLQRVPVVYRLNLAEAHGYFNAQNFKMRDKDVILVANSDGAQLAKFFTLVRGVTGIVSDIKSIGSSSSSSSSNNNNTGLSSGFSSGSGSGSGTTSAAN